MRLIRQVKADVIFSWDPFAPFEGHPDHRALAWAVSDAAGLAHFPLYHPDHLEEGLAPHRVTEWYWYSKAGWQTNKLVDISDTMETKLQALYAYDCQMVLTLDEFLAEARLLGLAPEGIDPANYEPWIEMAMRAVHGELGAQADVTYAEAFRYERVEVPEFLKL
jgi:LmbE family N-acetylglucosaminyl deacetylase